MCARFPLAAICTIAAPLSFVSRSATAVMDLRSGSRVGAGILQSIHRPKFEEGVQLLLTKWTALQLAVENQWGGRDSRDKAEDMYDEILEWFYKRKGAP